MTEAAGLSETSVDTSTIISILYDAFLISSTCLFYRHALSFFLSLFLSSMSPLQNFLTIYMTNTSPTTNRAISELKSNLSETFFVCIITKVSLPVYWDRFRLRNVELHFELTRLVTRVDSITFRNFTSYVYTCYRMMRRHRLAINTIYRTLRLLRHVSGQPNQLVA